MIQPLLALGTAACTSATTTGSIPFDPTCFFSAPTNVWFLYVFVPAISIMIAIIAIIYALGPLLGRNDIKTWCKVKLYELFLTIALAIFFLTLSGFLYSMDPTGTLSQVGLLPHQCDPQYSNTPSSANVDNIYSVALCDMYAYNSQVAQFSEGVFLLSMVAGLAPIFNVASVGFVGGPSKIPGGGATASGVSAPPGFGLSVAIQVNPIQIVLQYIVPLMGAYFTAVLIAVMQQIMLSSAMIIYSAFMVMGLVARAFSVTKTFGGALIAFALGIGFIYPLVTLISYGFLVSVINNVGVANVKLGSIADLAGTGTLGLGTAVTEFLTSFLTGAGICNGPVSLCNVLTPYIVYGGFIASGLMLLPLLDLIIVDAFIVDTSRVIGERMELMSLLTRII